MELRALWQVIQRRWWLIVLPSIAALAVAAYGYLKAPPAGGYSAGMRLTAATPPSEGQGYEDSLYYPWLTSEYVVNALTDWVRTSSFAQEVSAQLATQNIEVPAGAIQGGINADNERSVMVFTISGQDAALVQQIAEASALVLQQKAAVYFPQFGTRGTQVVLLDTPVVVPVPPPLSRRLEPLVRFGLGVAAGVALAFLVEYLDPTLRQRSQVEALGLAVLAEVPRERGS